MARHQCDGHPPPLPKGTLRMDQPANFPHGFDPNLRAIWRKIKHRVLRGGQKPSEEASFGFSSLFDSLFNYIFLVGSKTSKVWSFLYQPFSSLCNFPNLRHAHKFPTSFHSFLDLVWSEMSFEDLEWGRTRPGQSPLALATKRREEDDSSQAVAAGVFRINTAVSAFYRLVNSLGTPKDTLELREKLWVFLVFFFFLVPGEFGEDFSFLGFD